MSGSSIDNVLEQLFPQGSDRRETSPSAADLERLEGQFGGLAPSAQPRSERAPQPDAAEQQRAQQAEQQRAQQAERQRAQQAEAQARQAAEQQRLAQQQQRDLAQRQQPRDGGGGMSESPRARRPADSRRRTPTGPISGGNDLDDLESMLEAAVQQRRSTQPQSGAQTAAVRAAQESAQKKAPVDPEQAKLLGMYRQRIGDLQRPVKITCDPKMVPWSKYDKRTQYLFRLASQGGTFEQLIGRSGMPEIHATYMVAILVSEKLIG